MSSGREYHLRTVFIHLLRLLIDGISVGRIRAVLVVHGDFRKGLARSSLRSHDVSVSKSFHVVRFRLAYESKLCGTIDDGGISGQITCLSGVKIDRSGVSVDRQFFILCLFQIRIHKNEIDFRIHFLHFVNGIRHSVVVDDDHFSSLVDGRLHRLCKSRIRLLSSLIVFMGDSMGPSELCDGVPCSLTVPAVHDQAVICDKSDFVLDIFLRQGFFFISASAQHRSKCKSHRAAGDQCAYFLI